MQRAEDIEREMQLRATIAEWEDLRDEIKRRIDQRTLITQFMITLISALLTAAFVTGNYYIIGFIPFASAYCLYHIKATYSIHHWLVTYVRERIEGQKLSRIFPNSDVQWLSWETFYDNEVSEDDKKRASRRPFYNMLGLSLFLGCGVAFILYTLLNLPIWLTVIIASLYLGLGIVAVSSAWMKDPQKQSARVRNQPGE